MLFSTDISNTLLSRVSELKSSMLLGSVECMSFCPRMRQEIGKILAKIPLIRDRNTASPLIPDNSLLYSIIIAVTDISVGKSKNRIGKIQALAQARLGFVDYVKNF